MKSMLEKLTGRKRRIRTALPDPKTGVLPLHYVLDMVPQVGFKPTIRVSGRAF